MRHIRNFTHHLQNLSKLGRQRTMATLGAEELDCIALENEFGANNYHPLPVVLKKGEGKIYKMFLCDF